MLAVVAEAVTGVHLVQVEVVVVPLVVDLVLQAVPLVEAELLIVVAVLVVELAVDQCQTEINLAEQVVLESLLLDTLVHKKELAARYSLAVGTHTIGLPQAELIQDRA